MAEWPVSVLLRPISAEAILHSQAVKASSRPSVRMVKVRAYRRVLHSTLFDQDNGYYSVSVSIWSHVWDEWSRFLRLRSHG